VTVVSQARPVDDPEAELSKARASFALVARIQAGDKAAFAELYQQHFDDVFRFIYYRFGGGRRYRHLAEDFTQEVFLRALRGIDRFEWNGRPVIAWLVTIARNLTNDHWKSARYRLETLTGDGAIGDPNEPDTAGQHNPEDAVLDFLQGRDLLAVLLQLNDEQQEVLILRFWRGLTVAETAAAMRKNDGAIKALQYRAVRSMARLLGPIEELL
jgi:RNA polymerase sigma-70 factor, ECF subfamily